MIKGSTVHGAPDNLERFCEIAYLATCTYLVQFTATIEDSSIQFVTVKSKKSKEVKRHKMGFVTSKWISR